MANEGNKGNKTIEEEIAKILVVSAMLLLCAVAMTSSSVSMSSSIRKPRASAFAAVLTFSAGDVPTRFAGEGVAVELVKQILNEARERPLHFVFACTAEERAAKFFSRLGFRRVGPRDTMLSTTCKMQRP